jgi:hypothetical protein
MKRVFGVVVRLGVALIAGYVAGVVLFAGLAATWLFRNGYMSNMSKPV